MERETESGSKAVREGMVGGRKNEEEDQVKSEGTEETGEEGKSSIEGEEKSRGRRGEGDRQALRRIVEGKMKETDVGSGG